MNLPVMVGTGVAGPAVHTELTGDAAPDRAAHLQPIPYAA